MRIVLLAHGTRGDVQPDVARGRGLMRAGIPAVVIPFAADQTFWGEQVHRLGIGSRPVPHRQLSADRLARAIREAVESPALRQRAGELGRALQAEMGWGTRWADRVGRLKSRQQQPGLPAQAGRRGPASL